MNGEVIRSTLLDADSHSTLVAAQVTRPKFGRARPDRRPTARARCNERWRRWPPRRPRGALYPLSQSYRLAKHTSAEPGTHGLLVDYIDTAAQCILQVCEQAAMIE